MNLSEFLPERGERCLFTGQTGSGKTTLAQYLLAFRVYVVALDSKGTLRWPGYELATKFEQLQKLSAPRLIYRPSIYEANDLEIRDAFFEWIFRRKHTTVYVDELAAISEGTGEYPFHFGACVTRGRELGIETWVSTQRPTAIPQIVMSESEHAFVFKLKLPQDRQRAAEIVGVDRDRIGQLEKKQFFYAPQSGDVSGPYTLDLEAGALLATV